MRRRTCAPRLGLLAALGVLAGACTIGYEARYLFDMHAERRGAGGTLTLPRVGELAAADGGLRIGWRVKDYGLRVEVRNDLDLPVVARWSEARFIDEDGGRHRLVVDQSWSARHRQRRALVQPGTAVEVSLFPSDWLEPYGDPAAQRAVRGRGLFASPGLRLGGDAGEIVSRARHNVGKTLAVELPVSVGEEHFEYVFRFTVESVSGVPVKDVI